MAKLMTGLSLEEKKEEPSIVDLSSFKEQEISMVVKFFAFL